MVSLGFTVLSFLCNHTMHTVKFVGMLQTFSQKASAVLTRLWPEITRVANELHVGLRAGLGILVC